MNRADGVGRVSRRMEWGLIAAWALLALLLDLVWIDLYAQLWVGALLLPLALWLGIGWLAVLIAFQGFRDKRWAATLVLLAGLTTVGTIQSLAGDRMSQLARFYAMKPRYQAIVGSIERGATPAAGTRYIVEAGPPLRVAFPWPGGLLDNWCGVVYDPSGLVLKVRDLRPDLSNLGDPTLREVRTLFGGDIRRCEPLGGPWYFCCFT